MTFKIFLILHIIGGTVALLTGTINLVRHKGDKNHKLVGKFFTYGMLAAGFSSLVLSYLHPSYFLFIVGVFTIYLASTGNRYIYLKMLGKDQHPAIIDWLITICMAVTAVIFIGVGVKNLIVSNNFGIVLIVFGVLGFRFVKTDLDNYRGKPKAKNYWLLVHLQRMTGAYTAAITAFIVVNAKYSPVDLPSFVFWLLPTVILTPLIISWTRKYKVKAVTPLAASKEVA
jgi:uncharacterized membrane protein